MTGGERDKNYVLKRDLIQKGYFLLKVKSKLGNMLTKIVLVQF